VSRSILLGLIIYILVVLGIATVRGEFISLAFPFVLYLLAGLFFSPDDLKLEVTRHLSTERTTPQTDVNVTVTVTNRGSNISEVLLEDILPVDLRIRSGHTRHMLRLPKDSIYAFTYAVAGPRGGYGFEGVRATINDPLRVTSREVQVVAPGQLFIFPLVTRLRHVAIRPRRTRVYAGMIPARAGGSGTEFYGVREYHPGDPPRSINWRASAQHEDLLFTNEFQQERVADIGVILDGRMRTNEFAHGYSIFEHSVQAAAALSDALLNQGNRVGLLVYASYLRWTIPGYGKIQREKILYALAHARPGGSDIFADLEHLPTRLFPRESQMILVSPLHEDDLMPLIKLRGQGYQILVVCPNPVKFELSYLPKTHNVELASRVIQMERRLLLQRIQHAGIQILDWDVAEPFDLVVQRKLSHPPAWLRAVGR
jgi:uncharacterized protein (DUF58 family)